MTSLSARTIPVALALALVSMTSMAEDRPNTTLVQKSKSSAATPSAKARTQAQTPVSGDATVKAGSKQGRPATGGATPTAEQSYEGCQHGKGAEA